MFWLTLLAFLVILSLLVFVHELGHFVMAKLSGVEVEEFAFGFPPRLFGFQVKKTRELKELITREQITVEIEDVKSGATEKIKETITEDTNTSEKFHSKWSWKFAWGHRAVSKLQEAGLKNDRTTYCINLIPFGGYVKMLGEEKNSGSPKSFNQKKARYRLAIVVAGVCMNLILAGVLLSIGFMVGTSPIRLNTQKFGGQTVAEVTVAQVLPDSAAAKADLKTGDVITQFSSAEEFAKYTRENIKKPIIITVNREGLMLTKTVQLSDNPDGPLGAGIADVSKVKLPFFKAIAAGFADAYLTTIYIIGLLWSFFSHIFQPGQIAENVAGPIKIFNITGQAVKMGFVYLIQFAALLSINVALVNILPLPALDGGRAVIILAEGVVRKKIMRVEIENLLHMIGFIIIIVLVLVITLREIIALF